MWLKCFHGNRLNIAADKGTSVAPPPPFHPPSSLPHSSWRQQRQLSSASSPKFALTLGITDPYLGLRCPKRLNTAHGVPDTFLSHTHTQAHTHGREETVLEQALIFIPPPPSHHKREHCRSFWMSAGQDLPHICEMPRHFGQLAPTGGRVEPRREGLGVHRRRLMQHLSISQGEGGASVHTHLWATAGSGEPESDKAPVEGSQPAWCCSAPLEETNTTLLVKHP